MDWYDHCNHYWYTTAVTANAMVNYYGKSKSIALVHEAASVQ